jgi:hypothetical protein
MASRKELVDKMYNCPYVQETEAKRCALIAIDEILSMGIMSDSGDWRMAKLYWQEVKTEIENYDTNSQI